MKRYFTQLTLLLLVATYAGAQTITVPDANFRAFLVATYTGTSQSGNTVTFTTPSVTDIIEINCSSRNISDLTGIEHFTALQILWCYNNPVTSLNVSSNTALRVLRCYGNPLLTSLNVSSNTALTSLWCNNNQLTSLDVSNNTALTELWCFGNPLTSLNVSSNTALTSLRCNNNQLTSLDVSNNAALTELWCHNNQLTSLNVSGATILQILWCYNNPMTSLNVSSATTLTQLICYSNQLTSLDVSNNTALVTLRCQNNQLTGALNLSANTALNNLMCQDNKIPIILTDNDGISSITKDAQTQVAVFRNNSTTPTVPTARTGAFVLGTTGAIVNFTTGSSSAGNLVASAGTNPNIVPPLPSGTDRISPDKFWTITQSGLSNFTYNLILDLRTISGITAFNLLKVLKRNNNTVPWQDVAQAPINATVRYLEPFILINGLTSFSDFSIGGGGSDNPLPVELVNFTGAATRNGVRLSWTTASEMNNAGFEVRRSEAGSDFQTVASYAFLPELRGKGTTTSTTNYAFLDASVEAGKTYLYRLRSVDFDGTLHDYAQTVTVEVREPVQPKVYEYALAQNYPNPFNPSTVIRFAMKEAGTAMLTITDVLGRVALTETIQASVGENAYRFNAVNLGSGVYFYTLRAGAFQQTKKMMLVK